MRYRWLLFLLFSLTLTPGLVQAQAEAGDLIGRINALRGSLGLPGYTLNGALAAAAQGQAQWMADTGTVSHTRPDGSTPRLRAAAAGYSTTEVSENIYAGTNAGVDDAWTFWINSAIHYAGLTNGRYKEVGIGVAHTAWGAAYVLVFGNPGGPEYVPPQVNTSGSGSGGQPSYVAGLDAQGNIMHEVQPGDTPGDIALIYGYTWGDIPRMLALNGLSEADIRELKVGSIFLVPPQAGTYTPTAPAESPTPTATVWGEVTTINTDTPVPSAIFTPEPTLTATFGIATLDSLPPALALPTTLETATPAATAQMIAALT
ncbi:MAG TPA: CAP domain-containing protein, partial [Phototrophicaceae bacterium]|nr:CAP domain-containing protein [Phototrophicaceae bacterium]